MKRIEYTISKYPTESMGNVVNTYYVDFGSGWSYSISMTEEAWMWTTRIWAEAGFEIVNVGTRSSITFSQVEGL